MSCRAPSCTQSVEGEKDGPRWAGGPGGGAVQTRAPAVAPGLRKRKGVIDSQASCVCPGETTLQFRKFKSKAETGCFFGFWFFKVEENLGTKELILG